MNYCSSLAALPATFGELGALTILVLAGCPRLAALPESIGELKALKWLILSGCSSLAALPDAIGELSALTELDLSNCSSLVALPESIGGLDGLTTLYLDDCDKLTFPPPHTHGDDEFGDVVRVQGLLANTTRFLDDGLSAADADDDAKRDFLEIIRHAPFADRIATAVRNDPALTDLTNDKGERAIDLACLACRYAMERTIHPVEYVGMTRPGQA